MKHKKLSDRKARGRDMSCASGETGLLVGAGTLSCFSRTPSLLLKVFPFGTMTEETFRILRIGKLIRGIGCDYSSFVAAIKGKWWSWRPRTFPKYGLLGKACVRVVHSHLPLDRRENHRWRTIVQKTGIPLKIQSLCGNSKRDLVRVEKHGEDGAPVRNGKKRFERAGHRY